MSEKDAAHCECVCVCSVSFISTHNSLATLLLLILESQSENVFFASFSLSFCMINSVKDRYTNQFDLGRQHTTTKLFILNVNISTTSSLHIFVIFIYLCYRHRPSSVIIIFIFTIRPWHASIDFFISYIAWINRIMKRTTYCMWF